MVPSCVSVETDVMPHRNMTHASTTALMAQKSTASILRMASLLPLPVPTVPVFSTFAAPMAFATPGPRYRTRTLYCTGTLGPGDLGPA